MSEWNRTKTAWTKYKTTHLGYKKSICTIPILIHGLRLQKYHHKNITSSLPYICIISSLKIIIFMQSGNKIVSIKVEKVAQIFCKDFSNKKYRDAMKSIWIPVIAGHPVPLTTTDARRLWGQWGPWEEDRGSAPHLKQTFTVWFSCFSQFFGCLHHRGSAPHLLRTSNVWFSWFSQFWFSRF